MLPVHESSSSELNDALGQLGEHFVEAYSKILASFFTYEELLELCKNYVIAEMALEDKIPFFSHRSEIIRHLHEKSTPKFPDLEGAWFSEIGEYQGLILNNIKKDRWGGAHILSFELNEDENSLSLELDEKMKSSSEEHVTKIPEKIKEIEMKISRKYKILSSTIENPDYYGYISEDGSMILWVDGKKWIHQKTAQNFFKSLRSSSKPSGRLEYYDAKVDTTDISEVINIRGPPHSPDDDEQMDDDDEARGRGISRKRRNDGIIDRDREVVFDDEPHLRRILHKKEPWACSRCTFLNTNYQTTCEICSSARSTPDFNTDAAVAPAAVSAVGDVTDSPIIPAITYYPDQSMCDIVPLSTGVKTEVSVRYSQATFNFTEDIGILGFWTGSNEPPFCIYYKSETRGLQCVRSTNEGILTTEPIKKREAGGEIQYVISMSEQNIIITKQSRDELIIQIGDGSRVVSNRKLGWYEVISPVMANCSTIGQISLHGQEKLWVTEIRENEAVFTKYTNRRGEFMPSTGSALYASKDKIVDIVENNTLLIEQIHESYTFTDVAGVRICLRLTDTLELQLIRDNLIMSTNVEEFRLDLGTQRYFYNGQISGFYCVPNDQIVERISELCRHAPAATLIKTNGSITFWDVNDAKETELEQPRNDEKEPDQMPVSTTSIKNVARVHEQSDTDEVASKDDVILNIGDEDSLFEYLGSTILEHDLGAEMVHSVEQTMKSYELYIHPTIQLRDVIYCILDFTCFIVEVQNDVKSFQISQFATIITNLQQQSFRTLLNCVENLEYLDLLEFDESLSKLDCSDVCFKDPAMWKKVQFPKDELLDLDLSRSNFQGDLFSLQQLYTLKLNYFDSYLMLPLCVRTLELNGTPQEYDLSYYPNLCSLYLKDIKKDVLVRIKLPLNISYLDLSHSTDDQKTTNSHQPPDGKKITVCSSESTPVLHFYIMDEAIHFGDAEVRSSEFD